MLTMVEFKTKARWTRTENYSGQNLSAYLTGPAQTRDSEILEQSNFAAALEMLGGESETVKVHRFNHWGCGWFEQIMVDSSDETATLKLFEIYQSLESYPTLDESDLYERENEYHTEFAEDAADDLAQALTHHLGLPEEIGTSSEMRELAIELNIECQRYYGNDSCINVYKQREPDTRDIERVQTCLKQLRWSYEPNENPLFDLICAMLDVNGDV